VGAIGSATAALPAFADDAPIWAQTDGTPAPIVTTQDRATVNVLFRAEHEKHLVVHCANTPNNRAFFDLLDPTGKFLTQGVCPGHATPGEAALEFAMLPADGVYTLVVDGWKKIDTTVSVLTYANTYAVKDTNTRPFDVQPSAAGQDVIVPFHGKAGDRILIECGSAHGIITKRVFDPAYNEVTYDSSNPSEGCGSNPGDPSGNLVLTLPSTGRYVLLLDYYLADDVNPATIRFFRVPADASAAATVDGAAAKPHTTVPGQNAKVTFTASAGDTVFLTCEATDNNAASLVQLSVPATLTAPDGSELGGGDCVDSRLSDSKWLFGEVSVRASGTYTVFLDVPYTTTASFKVKVSGRPADRVAQAYVGADPVSVSTAVHQFAAVSFTIGGTDKFVVECRLGKNSPWYESTLTAPDGTVVANDMCEDHDGETPQMFASYAFTTPGKYTIRLKPGGNERGSFSMVLRRVL
jgi:hypothetical protein